MKRGFLLTRSASSATGSTDVQSVQDEPIRLTPNDIFEVLTHWTNEEINEMSDDEFEHIQQAWDAWDAKIREGHTCMRNRSEQMQFDSLDAAGRVIFEKCENRMLDSMFSHPADSSTISWLEQSGFSMHRVAPLPGWESFCNCWRCRDQRRQQTLCRSVVQSLVHSEVLRKLTHDEEEFVVQRMHSLCRSRYGEKSFLTPVVAVFDMLDALYHNPRPEDIWLTKTLFAKKRVLAVTFCDYVDGPYAADYKDVSAHHEFWQVRQPVCEVAKQIQFPQDSPQILIYSFTCILYGVPSKGGFGWMSQSKDMETASSRLAPPPSRFVWSATCPKEPHPKEMASAQLRKCQRCKFHGTLHHAYNNSPTEVCLFCTTMMWECQICMVERPQKDFSESKSCTQRNLSWHKQSNGW